MTKDTQEVLRARRRMVQCVMAIPHNVVEGKAQ
jgi:hypothetical protein